MHDVWFFSGRSRCLAWWNMGYDSDSFGCFFLDSDQKSWANPAVSSVRLEWWLGECNTLCHDGKSKKSRWKIADITWYSCKTQGFYDCTDFVWSACWILSCNKAIWTSSLWRRKLWRKSSLSIWVGKIATWSVWKGKCSIWFYRNRQCICQRWKSLSNTESIPKCTGKAFWFVVSVWRDWCSNTAAMQNLQKKIQL